MCNLNEAVPNFPGEDVGIIAAVVIDALLHIRRSDLARLGSADDSRADASGFLVAVEDLGDAAVGDAELARDDARADAGRRQFHDLQPDVIG